MCIKRIGIRLSHPLVPGTPGVKAEICFRAGGNLINFKISRQPTFLARIQLSAGTVFRPSVAAHATETEDLAQGEAGIVGIARGAAEVRGVVTPIAAPQDAAAAGVGRRAAWVGAAGVGCAVPVPAPLLDISRHVAKPISVWREVSHRAGVRIAAEFEGGIIGVRSQIVTVVFCVAIVIGLGLADGVAQWKALAAQAAAGGLLPFRLGWQTVAGS